MDLRTELLEAALAKTERKLAADLKRKVEELNSLSQQLRLARDSAQDASRRKSEMISVVSHDLRAPLPPSVARLLCSWEVSIRLSRKK